MAADNTSLGEFNLDGLPPAPRGVPKIEVTFDIDSNGILNVAARDTASSKSQSIRISGSTRLPADTKQRMIDEAEKYAEADKQRRADAETFNTADATVYQADKLLAEFAAKLTDDLKKRMADAQREVRDAIAKKDAKLAAEKTEALRKLLSEAGTAIYAQTPGTGDMYREVRYPPPGAGEAPHSKVVDADFRETK